MEQIIFENTTTIGIRKIPVERTILPRLVKNVQTPFGEAMVKVCELNGQQRFYPEYESVTALCPPTSYVPTAKCMPAVMEACR